MRKSVLIIGCSSGIGQATAKLFAEKGYDIFATFNNTSLNDLEKYCSSQGSKIKTYNLNVRNHDEIENVVKNVFEEAEYLESAIYCAGVSKSEKLLIDETKENIDEILDINLASAIYFAREVLKYFYKQKKGSLIFISSIYGEYGGSCESVYSASKGGLIALCKALASECGAFNVRVNCVAPGFVDTRMTESFNEKEREDIIRQTPLGRLGQSDDIAKAILFLSSDNSSFISGETITISGGAVKY